MKKHSIYYVLCVIIVISGCKSSASNSGVSAVKGKIICEVFYRAGGEQSLAAAPPILFGGGTDQQSRTFEGLAFEAQFLDDPYEGSALSIVIVHLETDTEILRQLYQFDSQNPPENQFIGGHGFTGLNYVFQPKSPAEMQYFCSVRPK